MNRPSLVRRPRAGVRLRNAAAVLALAAALFTAGAVVLDPLGAPGLPDDFAAPSRTEGPGGSGSLEALRQRARELPRDPSAWARLGMAHVERARVSADPANYAAAEDALRKSLALQPHGNYTAETGMGALAAARHDFPRALTWARAAVTSNAYSAPAHGVLADAYTQLGRYEEAFAAVQRMSDLRPDASSLARASYAWELRGDAPRARALMNRSLREGAGDAETVFARTHLASLAQDSGDHRRALREAEEGLRVAPRDAGLLEARARARAALGDTDGAVADYTAAIAIVPLPHFLIGLGELQEALGHREQAQTQYALLRAQQRLLRAGGSPPDVDDILFEADHGRPARAVAQCRTTLTSRPFLAVHDACAWALHQAGKDSEALHHADEALALGTRSALFHYHRAMIHRSLGNLPGARADLRRALGIDARFHPLHGPAARTALSRIDSNR